MAQTVFTGTVNADQFDASSKEAWDIAVFRGLGAGDIALGGAGNDRASLAGAGASVSLGAGNDLVLVGLGRHASAVHDTIDGGAGMDTLNITVNSNQLTATVKAELVRLQQYLAGDTTQRFVSDIFHIDMIDVEQASVRVDGVVKSLAEVAPTSSQQVLSFEDVIQFPYSGAAISNGYAGFNWQYGAGTSYVLVTQYFSNVWGDPAMATVATPVGGNVLVVASYGLDGDISRSDGSVFTFRSVDASMYLMDNVPVTFTGYLNGTQVGQTTVVPNHHQATHVAVDWAPIDHLVIHTPYNMAQVDNFTYIA
jgi:Ca2+-binding RTX toxin-like protein